MVLIVHGVSLETTDQGFLVDMTQWNEDVANQLAQLDNIELTSEHWEILGFIRDYYNRYKHLPNARMFTKAIAKQLGEQKGNSRYLHRLFPDGPLKTACKLAGLPKPPTCL
ncbi:TusE/DsrC/DsvC family sulfur relay protein [Methylicorpusculum sp.]|uniref:TusE/DsrC/DsvC family sulfur relay protein n=1 Tax=Methylicorpusculum sp. TaxID=2713644 RepID=UPI002725548C|nr:TusE/DsrC/DsvC family sulfur relay protein [Methylicorpusculum sp.]MDO8844553.1 TusE/DsrC/DsvC family sulfur relay protein [Methylicorpusculum sp.]MDO9240931.1 TusE/DsrC/DsvC family sulfur relay protein [Methylicorpusculum sp.]MDP2177867.1 TusE/DsrC/DsvC family sulfur relay protein [Methylicorpusculum sp.]MDP3529287.1 TusE/DsrC/DsvC family sulfur relay protein [Methylicorpusculum sp.]MDZ4150675.1 TusE/DsrC/DsvC family sulfur relay protein [Methylicorpusculum sp.]